MKDNFIRGFSSEGNVANEVIQGCGPVLYWPWFWAGELINNNEIIEGTALANLVALTKCFPQKRSQMVEHECAVSKE